MGHPDKLWEVLFFLKRRRKKERRKPSMRDEHENLHFRDPELH